MEKEIVIKTTDLGKTYRLYNSNADRIIEGVDPLHKTRHKIFRALSHINIEIHRGEALGIIGVNGSGKSTLLKILTGVLSPSEGSVTVDGKVSALLELGAGFNPEYSGLENIYLNGTMMGYSQEEMEKKVPEIIQFADIGDFINQPVKSYSSGMFARLAFAVAISVDPDILVVDEALSVGDIFFQTKCFKKFEDFQNQGKTILFVSHDLSSIKRYCNRAILLNHGELVADTTPKEAIDIYKKIISKINIVKMENEISTENAEIDLENSSTYWKNSLVCNPAAIEYGDQRAKIIDFAIIDASGKITNTISKGEPFIVKIKVVFYEPVSNPIIAMTIKNNQGVEIAGTNTDLEQEIVGSVKAGDCVEVSFEQRAILQGGEYLMSFGCTQFEDDHLAVLHRLYDICNFLVISEIRKVGFFDMESACTVRINR